MREQGTILVSPFGVQIDYSQLRALCFDVDDPISGGENFSCNSPLFDVGARLPAHATNPSRQQQPDRTGVHFETISLRNSGKTFSERDNWFWFRSTLFGTRRQNALKRHLALKKIWKLAPKAMAPFCELTNQLLAIWKPIRWHLLKDDAFFHPKRTDEIEKLFFIHNLSILLQLSLHTSRVSKGTRIDSFRAFILETDGRTMQVLLHAVQI